MSHDERGEPVVWYALPAGDAGSLLIYADRLTAGETVFPVAVRVSMTAHLSPARIAAALRRMAETIEVRCAALETVDAPWLLEVTLVPEEE